MITEFFIDEAISNVEEGARLIGGAEESAPKNATRATAETNWKTSPSVTVCRAHSSVEIQNNAGSSFLIVSVSRYHFRRSFTILSMVFTTQLVRLTGR